MWQIEGASPPEKKDVIKRKIQWKNIVAWMSETVAEPALGSLDVTIFLHKMIPNILFIREIICIIDKYL